MIEEKGWEGGHSHAAAIERERGLYDLGNDAAQQLGQMELSH